MIFSRNKLFALKQALLKLGSISTSDGTVLIYDNESLEVGSEVFIDTEDGLTPAPDKDYIYDEKTVTVEGGVVKSITEKEVEQPVEEVVEEEVEEVETLEETVEEETEETTETVEELQNIIDEQKTMIEDLKAQIEELKKKLEEPAAEPAEDEFKNQPKKENKVDFSKYIKRK